MSQKIALAGATGNLGRLVLQALVAQGAEVVALVRPGTDDAKLSAFRRDNVAVVPVSLTDKGALGEALVGVSTVVSTLVGLRETLIDTQSIMLEVAAQAGVGRFIPSDYAIEFTKPVPKPNRNLDLRKEFHKILFEEQSAVAGTSILNGAFASLLTSVPFILDRVQKRVTFWENPDQPMDFTTMEDVASFTATAALDPSTPHILRIAGATVSARELATFAGKLDGANYELMRAGGLGDLDALIEQGLEAEPENDRDIYPMWQTYQHVRRMFDGGGRLEPLDNDRYPNIRLTPLSAMLAT